MTQARLSRAVIFAYGLPALPLALLTLPVFVYIPAFYASELGLPLAAVAQALLIVRLIDAFSDPVVGYLADRYPASGHRFGRRRLWFALSIPLVAVSAIMMFMPGEGVGATYLVVWGTALALSWTVAIIPLSAWGAELAQDYDGRTRVAGTREGMVLAGTMVAAALPALLPLIGYTSERAVMTTLALIVAIGLPMAAIITLLFVPEPPNRSRTRVSLTAGLAAMRRNAPFARLLGAFIANGLANAFPASLFLFFVTHRLADPQAAGPLLFIYFLCGLISVPVWIAIAKRVGKDKAWIAGMCGACLGFVAVPLLGPGDVTAFAVICVVTGAMLGADLALPPAIQADVIDVDTADTGEQRSGAYFAAWGMATKISLALGSAVALGVLPVFGFDPGLGIVEETGLAALSLAYGSAPIVLKLIAIGLMVGFPLNQRMQEDLRQRIDARAG